MTQLKNKILWKTDKNFSFLENANYSIQQQHSIPSKPTLTNVEMHKRKGEAKAKAKAKEETITFLEPKNNNDKHGIRLECRKSQCNKSNNENDCEIE